MFNNEDNSSYDPTLHLSFVLIEKPQAAEMTNSAFKKEKVWEGSLGGELTLLSCREFNEKIDGTVSE